MTSEFQNGQHQIITYNSLRETKAIAPGTVVAGVKPQDLWTTQGWIEEKKVQDALSRDCKTDDCYPTRGYLHKHKGKNILVLGDGNTKAIVAWIRGQRVEFTIEGELPKGADCTPLSRLKNQYNDLFREFEYS